MIEAWDYDDTIKNSIPYGWRLFSIIIILIVDGYKNELLSWVTGSPLLSPTDYIRLKGARNQATSLLPIPPLR
jgi:hypothetical protein